MHFTVNPFGKIDDKEVSLYTFITDSGLEVSVTNYGGTITSINSNHGKKPLRLVYGFPGLNPYINSDIYAGAIVGRYANRIAGAEFCIGENTYRLNKNEGENQLHGGISGFNRKVWETQLCGQANGVCTLKLYLHSPSLDEGFPGNLDVWATYQIAADNKITLSYLAKTDGPTHVNLTTHSYFNLGGFEGNVLDHLLTINANRYLPVNGELIPTGTLTDLAGTPFDFRKPKAVGADIDLVDNLYDHCFVLNNPSLEEPSAILKNPKNNITLSIYTTQPGIQCYTPLIKPKHSGIIFPVPENGNWAVCLEPQHFPNSPKTPHFPSTLLLPGKEYQQTTIFCFDLGD